MDVIGSTVLPMHAEEDPGESDFWCNAPNEDDSADFPLIIRLRLNALFPYGIKDKNVIK